ncbi:MAG: hypothetical protein H6739_05100 [Alphaproteobacteria bacterium]|nr:hypothetical protein [Alphaproteobacteria bacterium]
MRWIWPIFVMFVGVSLLQVSSRARAVADGIVYYELVEPHQVEVVTLQIQAASGVLGLGVMFWGVWLLWQWATDNTELFAVWARMLGPLASEYGRRVEIHPQEGVGFASMVDGVRTEVLVQPLNEGFVSVWVGAPGRQLLMLVPADTRGAMMDDSDWKLVGHRENWVLRAELPSVAKPLMNETALVVAIDDVFRHPWVQAIRHDYKGIEVLMRLMPPEDLTEMVRRSLMVCRHLRKVNG